MKSCQASPFRKLILRTQDHSGTEKCSSPDYVTCPWAKQYREESPSGMHCPFLRESLMQYCSAASVTRYVPYNEGPDSRCLNESHRYCEMFRALAHVGGPVEAAGENAPPAPAGEPGMPDEYVEGVHVPADVFYSANHMWIDVREDGTCHLGVDALFAKVMGRIDALSFVPMKGTGRPAAVFTVRGLEFRMVFPNRILVTATNNYLRADSERVTTDPYGRGWMFEGREATDVSTGTSEPAAAGLISGAATAAWMREEIHRVSTLVHEQCGGACIGDAVLMNDGGSFADGLGQLVHRDTLLHIFTDFFSPYATR